MSTNFQVNYKCYIARLRENSDWPDQFDFLRNFMAELYSSRVANSLGFLFLAQDQDLGVHSLPKILGLGQGIQNAMFVPKNVAMPPNLRHQFVTCSKNNDKLWKLQLFFANIPNISSVRPSPLFHQTELNFLKFYQTEPELNPNLKNWTFI